MNRYWFNLIISAGTGNSSPTTGLQVSHHPAERWCIQSQSEITPPSPRFDPSENECTLKRPLRPDNLNLSYTWVLNLNIQYIYESSLYFILVFDANYNASQCRTPVVAWETNDSYFSELLVCPWRHGYSLRHSALLSCHRQFLLLRTAANIMIRLHSAALWWSASSWKGEKLSNVLLLNYKRPLVVWSLCSAPLTRSCPKASCRFCRHKNDTGLFSFCGGIATQVWQKRYVWSPLKAAETTEDFVRRRRAGGEPACSKLRGLRSSCWTSLAWFSVCTSKFPSHTHHSTWVKQLGLF